MPSLPKLPGFPGSLLAVLKRHRQQSNLLRLALDARGTFKIN